MTVVGTAMVLAWWRATHPLYVLDDAFISLRYAANLVAGQGLVYNPSEYVEGYTNFLWVVIAALGIAGGFDAFELVRATGLLSWILLFPAVAVCARSVDRGVRPWHVAFASAWLLIPPSLGGFAGTGMETTFASLLVLVFAWLQHGGDPASTARRLMGSLAGLILVLLRPDLGLFVAASFLIHGGRGLRAWWAGSPLRASGIEMMHRFGLTAAGLIGWLLWKHWYYGALLPNTYYAKQYGAFSLDAGSLYLFSWVASYPQVVVFVLLCVLTLTTTRDRGGLARFTLLALTFQVLYMLELGGDFMEYRMMHHIYPLLIAGAVPGLATCASLSRRAAVGFALVATALSFAPTVYETEYHMQPLEGMTRCCGVPGIRFGKKLKEMLPPYTIIATTMAGGMPFYSGLRTVDQLGLNDRHISTLPPVDRLVRGHLRHAPRSYLKSRGVHLVFNHPKVCSCSKPCIERGERNVFLRLGRNNCLRSTYLTLDEDLTRLFCTSPAKFLVRGLDCSRFRTAERRRTVFSSLFARRSTTLGLIDPGYAS